MSGTSEPIDWRDYLSLAQILAETDKQCHQRSAISRAYYAAFCTSRNWLERKDGFRLQRTGDSHRQVWTAMRDNRHQNKHAQRLRKKISLTGERLKERRVDADYSNKVANLKSEMEQCLRDAHTILATLDSLDELNGNE